MRFILLLFDSELTVLWYIYILFSHCSSVPFLSVRDALGMNSDQPFSTYDRDNDGRNGTNCAMIHGGAWWYHGGNISLSSDCFTWRNEMEGLNDTCTLSNLNGDYRYADYRGIFWDGLAKNECGILRTQMMIRPSLE